MTAAEKILQKSLVGSTLDSRQWNGIQAGLRDRAFFSSQVTSSRILGSMREMVAEQAAGGKSLSEIRRDLRPVIASTGYDPGDDRGTIKDLYSKARLDIIVRTNVEQARGYVRHLEANTPGGFAAFPAQELLRVKSRQEPRDWRRRWADAGGKIYGGRMIALKDDPIWTKISAFGNPYPPFDFNSGMGVKGVKKSEAIQLGLITAEEIKAKTAEKRKARDEAPGFNDHLEAEVPADAQTAKRLKTAFGDQIEVENGVAKWRGEVIKDVQSGKRDAVTFGSGYNGQPLTVSHAQIASLATPKGGTAPAPADFELMPTVWRTPDSITALANGFNLLSLTGFDGNALNLLVDPTGLFVNFFKLLKS